jgi:hypothetical protein
VPFEILSQVPQGSASDKSPGSRLTNLRVGEILRVRRTRTAFWKQSYQNLTCHLYRVKEIKKNYLITLRRLKYPAAGYNGSMQKTEEDEAEKFIHITRIVHINTDYLYDPSSAYTHYQAFVRHVRDVSGSTYSEGKPRPGTDQREGIGLALAPNHKTEIANPSYERIKYAGDVAGVTRRQS